MGTSKYDGGKNYQMIDNLDRQSSFQMIMLIKVYIKEQYFSHWVYYLTLILMYIMLKKKKDI